MRTGLLSAWACFGLLLLQPLPTGAAGPLGPKTAAGPTRKIEGRALDAHGKSVAGATVCLSLSDDSEPVVYKTTLLAQTQSRGDGRFELTPLGSVFQKRPHEPPDAFEIWAWQQGLAVGHCLFFGEPPREPFCIFLENESPLEMRLRNPDGSPCADAIVTPRALKMNRYRGGLAPKPVQDRLRARSDRDGRVSIRGLSGEDLVVTIERADFGEQSLRISGRGDLPVDVLLRAMRRVDGRLILPEGEHRDLSQLVFVAWNIPTGTQGRDKDGGASQTKWIDQYVIRPDRDGRFTIPHVPKGHGSLCCQWPSWDVPFMPCMRAVGGVPIDPDKNLKMDIALQKRVDVTRFVRDSLTKAPVADVKVSMGDEHWLGYSATDEEGCVRGWLSPGETYLTVCDLPPKYARWLPGPEATMVAPCGVEHCELDPIELVRECSIEGQVIDPAGGPFAGVRVHAICRIAEPRPGQAAAETRWTVTDYSGHFAVAGVEAGTRVSLVPVREGVALGYPVETVAGDEKPLRLQTKNLEFVALSGRVVGVDHRPIPGAQVVVEVNGSPDPASNFQTTVDSDGCLSTPADFPRNLKYRLTARSMLTAVASTDWVCPATSGNRLPDLVVDRSRLSAGARLSGNEIVATVDGRPICASYLLERAYPEPLGADGLSLLIADKGLNSKKISNEERRQLESDYFRMQQKAIRKYLRDQIKDRVHTEALLSTLKPNERAEIEKAVEKLFSEYRDTRLKDQFHVATQKQIEQKLLKVATSLTGLRREFRNRMLADEYLRCLDQQNCDPGLQQLLTRYNAHRDLYAIPERVGWQLLEVQFEEPLPDPRWDVDTAGHVEHATEGGESAKSQDESLTPLGEAKSTPDLLDEKGTLTYRLRTKASDPPSKTDGPDSAAGVHAAKYSSREQARRMVNEALSRLRQGESFECVAKKFHDSPNSEEGGWQKCVSPNTLADVKTVVALHNLAEGETSAVIETEHSFRIVRVVSRIPPGCKSFDEVEESIRDQIKAESRARTLSKLYSRTSIQSPYITDAEALLGPK